MLLWVDYQCRLKTTDTAGQRNEQLDGVDEDSLASLYSDFTWASPGKLFDLILSPILKNLYHDLNIHVSSVPICATVESLPSECAFELLWYTRSHT